MSKGQSIFLFLTIFLISLISSAYSAEPSAGSRVLGIVQKMESAVKGIEDYTCEVEQLFFQNGVEDQSHRFKFYFKKEKRIRVDFSHPYSSLTIFYSDGDKEATIMPFRSIPTLKFRFSVDNPMLKTLAGQRIDQTDMG